MSLSPRQLQYAGFVFKSYDCAFERFHTIYVFSTAARWKVSSICLLFYDSCTDLVVGKHTGWTSQSMSTTWLPRVTLQTVTWLEYRRPSVLYFVSICWHYSRWSRMSGNGYDENTFNYQYHESNYHKCKVWPIWCHNRAIASTTTWAIELNPPQVQPASEILRRFFEPVLDNFIYSVFCLEANDYIYIKSWRASHNISRSILYPFSNLLTIFLI